MVFMIYRDVLKWPLDTVENKNSTAEQHGTMGVSSVVHTGNDRWTSGCRNYATHKNEIRTNDNKYSRKWIRAWLAIFRKHNTRT